ncbi:xylulokinase [Nocardia acidivorans]|uniref:xylulokinase n=1 Tax=Nocardia acidivorans TaxID=404580 RepID=UPI00082DA46D|nr:xylulokinase [Nocardia acidivorans]
MLVAGVDSSTQSCKIVVRDADSGRLLRHGTAAHPPGTEIDPHHWWRALRRACDRAGGLDDISALSISGQQHGMICLDARGEVIRPALLWNDTRSAAAAEALVRELGDGDRDLGARRWADAVGTVPVASLTVTKLRWLADHEPENARRIAAIALPHDWLTWRLRGAESLDTLTTGRSDASGTGYFDAAANAYRRDLLALALRRKDTHDLVLPHVRGPAEPAGTADPRLGLSHLLIGPGCGDNAGAALGLGLTTGQVFLSLGTSGVIAAVSDTPAADRTGAVAGFADATGRFLPLACTLNATGVLDAMATALGVTLDRLSLLALKAAPGAGGLTHIPYLAGERTPNLPHATGSLHGMTAAAMTPENLARAAFEGLLCLMAEAMNTVRAQGISIDRITLIGGGARSPALRRLAPALLAVPIAVPAPGEYVAGGAARQAAWTLSGTADPPPWTHGETETYTAPTTPEVLTRYRALAPTSPER